MNFRFAVFAAVSSERQAREDKASLPDQVKTARAAGIAQGGIESVEPYILDGYSRTGYINLSDALNDIPPLAKAIQDAIADQYDVLIMDNLERMGDLAPMLSTLFKRHNKQLHSARQSGPITAPDQYDPSSDESGDIMINVEGIIQKYRLNKLRRGWKVGVPKRIENGLVPFRVPYGYDRVSKTDPPLQNANATYILKMKDWIIEGRPLSWIADQLDALGAPLPSQSGKRWHVETIRHILYNPFYAGIVAIGQKRREPSPKGRTYRQRTPPSQWKQHTGRHVPLWDESTYLAIQNEFARRLQLKNYAKTVYPLAGLFRCTVCKQKLIRRNTSHAGQLAPALGCKRGDSHVIIRYDAAIQLLADELTRALQKNKSEPVTSREKEARLRTSLDELGQRRARIQDGYESGLYTKEEASVRMTDLERQERTAQTQLEEHRRTQRSQADFHTLAHDLSQLGELQEWIATDDPAIVNRLLSALCENLWLDPQHTLTIDFRP